MGPKKVQSFPFLAEGFGVEFNSLGQPLISEPGPPVLRGFLHDALKWASQSSWREGSVRARFLKAMDSGLREMLSSSGQWPAKNILEESEDALPQDWRSLPFCEERTDFEDCSARSSKSGFPTLWVVLPPVYDDQCPTLWEVIQHIVMSAIQDQGRMRERIWQEDIHWSHVNSNCPTTRNRLKDIRWGHEHSNCSRIRIRNENI